MHHNDLPKLDTKLDKSRAQGHMKASAYSLARMRFAGREARQVRTSSDPEKILDFWVFVPAGCIAHVDAQAACSRWKTSEQQI